MCAPACGPGRSLVRFCTRSEPVCVCGAVSCPCVGVCVWSRYRNVGVDGDVTFSEGGRLYAGLEFLKYFVVADLDGDGDTDIMTLHAVTTATLLL